MSGQKQNALIAFLCFNITVIIYQFAFNRAQGAMTFGGIGSRLMTGLLIGAVVGGIVWGICAIFNR